MREPLRSIDLPLVDPPATVDVVVLGAGLAAAATAFRLAKEGVSVAVVAPEPGRVDPLAHVELGAVEQPHRTIASLREQAGALFAFGRHGAALLEADGLLDRCGGLWVAMESGEAAEIPRSVAALAALDEPAAAWDQVRVEEHLGGGHMGPALHLPRDGRVDPVRARRRWRDEAPDVAWVKGVPRMVQNHGHDGVVVAVDGRRVQAEVVVIATGASSAGLDSALEGRLMPVRDQWLRTAPVSRSLPVGRAGHGWTAWQQDEHGRLWVSGARWASPHLEVGETDLGEEGGAVPRIQERLEAFLRDRLGVEAAVEARGARPFALTSDGLPLIGPLPGDRRTIVAVGFGPSPVVWSVAAADSVARGILEGEGEVPRCLESRRLVRWRRG